jgi:hypothetical protein
MKCAYTAFCADANPREHNTSASAAVIALRPIIEESKGGAAEEQWILPSFYQFFMTIQSRVM